MERFVWPLNFYANKKVIGKMKDEYGGVMTDQFVGLKSNMYSIKK